MDQINETQAAADADLGPEIYRSRQRNGSENNPRPDEPQGLLVDLSDARLRRDVEKIHRLGPRVAYEMWLELGRDRLLRVEIERLVARYAQLSPDAVRVLGGDRFPERGP
jgi:hypothetical protein